MSKLFERLIGNMEKMRRIIAVLFIIYILYLIWAVMFKFSFSYAEIPYKRQYVNLDLFFRPYGSVLSPVIIGERVMNVLIFIPFGAYLYILGMKKFIPAFLIMLFTSIIFEILQYIFILGTSDIADVATNALGGVIGFLLAYLTYRISKREERMTRHFAIMSSAFTLIIITGTLIIKFGYMG